MQTELVTAGEEIYWRAMLNGGGSNEKQALAIVKLSDEDYLLVSQFLGVLISNQDIRLEEVRKVNEVHNKVLLTKPASEAPELIKEVDFLHDLRITLEHLLVLSPNSTRQNDATSLLGEYYQLFATQTSVDAVESNPNNNWFSQLVHRIRSKIQIIFARN